MRFYFLFLGIIALLLGLHFLFPQAAKGDDSMMRILYLCALLVLIGSGLTLQRTSRAENIKNAGIWVAIIAGLAIAYELLAKTSG